MTNTSHKQNIFLRMRPLHRIGISLLLAALTLVVTIEKDLSPNLRLMTWWDVFALTYILTCWIVFFQRSTLQIRNVARQEDGSRFFVLLVVTVASIASMVTVLLLVLSKKSPQQSEAYILPLAITGMLLSWFMVHTTFTLHYAHLYYNDDEDDHRKHAEGLSFPAE